MTEQRSRGWCLTVNNHTEEDELLVYDFCNQQGLAYGVFGVETGESGTPHLQGFLYFSTLKSFDQVRMLFDGRAHVERMRGTPQQAADYCKKDGNFYEFGELPMSNAQKGAIGKQSIEERWALAKAGRFEELPPEQIRTYMFIHARSLHVEDRDVLDNIWLWGPTGCGKSSYVRRNYAAEDVFSKPMNKWWDNYTGQPVVVIEDMDPRHGDFMAYFLKIWADHYAMNVETKHGMIKARPKTVIVTSQYPITDVFKDYQDQAAMFRRFKVKQYSGLFGEFV